jgi:hypothetical protein
MRNNDPAGKANMVFERMEDGENKGKYEDIKDSENEIV